MFNALFLEKEFKKSQKQKTLPFLLFLKKKNENKNRKTGITKFDFKKCPSLMIIIKT
jgi:hypothetical protein